MEIAEAKSKIDLANVITGSGVKLKNHFGKLNGLCPFHAENTPSFYVFDQKYHCFGCGEHGDVIDYIQRLYGYSFKNALKHLGIATGKPSAADRARIAAAKRKRQAEKKQARRESELAHTLALLIRATRKAMRSIETVEDLEAFSDVLHALPFWKHCHHILTNGDPVARSEVIDALKGMVTIDRKIDFNFDYREWLSESIEGKQKKVIVKNRQGAANDTRH
jgi:hypothetical protein